MSRNIALIVDDEPDIRELLSITLTRLGLLVDAAQNVTTAKQMLAQTEYDLCFTDMMMPDGTGLDLVKHIAERHQRVPVAVITAFGSVDGAVEALKAGAFDFVSKPVDLGVLRRLVQSALKLSEQKKSEAAATSTSKLLGESPVMQLVRQTIAKVARSQAPVYIAGESGSGKELVARMIHEQGPRANGPFIPVNCGAIPAELMESEFFGHVKGSFTGAHADKEGLFQAANGGTLFLDEAADLPMHMQVKLLRVIQEKTVRAVGGRQEMPIDVRILSATHKNLANQVELGLFRQDLYYRINVIEVRVPALRERREDIPLLATKYLERIAPEFGVERPQLSLGAMRALAQYDFPGNVRELENVLERAIALCDEQTIEVHDLRLEARVAPPQAKSLSAAPNLAVVQREAQAAHDPSKPAPTGSNLIDYIDSLEREAIIKALEECRYNKTKAAAKLGITFRAMRYKLKKLGIE